jgi:glutamine amidotransferase PdxT
MLMKNNILSYLSLNDTKLGIIALQKIIEGLVFNTCIGILRLSKNGLNSCEAIVKLLEMNLLEVDLSRNNLSEAW